MTLLVMEFALMTTGASGQLLTRQHSTYGLPVHSDAGSQHIPAEKLF